MTVWKVYQSNSKLTKLQKRTALFEGGFSMDKERMLKVTPLLLALLFSTAILLASYQNSLLFFKELAFSLFISVSLLGLKLFNNQSDHLKKKN
jgi:hypothetical protein